MLSPHQRRSDAWFAHETWPFEWISLLLMCKPRRWIFFQRILAFQPPSSTKEKALVGFSTERCLVDITWRCVSAMFTDSVQPHTWTQQLLRGAASTQICVWRKCCKCHNLNRDRMTYAAKATIIFRKTLKNSCKEALKQRLSTVVWPHIQASGCSVSGHRVTRIDSIDKIKRSDTRRTALRRRHQNKKDR